LSEFIQAVSEENPDISKMFPVSVETENIQVALINITYVMYQLGVHFLWNKKKHISVYKISDTNLRIRCG
jgi:hypothetical protein